MNYLEEEIDEVLHELKIEHKKLTTEDIHQLTKALTRKFLGRKVLYSTLWNSTKQIPNTIPISGKK